MNEVKKRKTYLDVLKILACIAVIVMHLCVTKNGSLLNWSIFKIFNTVGNFAVPIFVMVSGSLLLDKNKKIDYKNIYLKYIPRLLISLIIINVIIYLVNNIIDHTFSLGGLVISISDVFLGKTPIPYWYIYMMVGLYAITPMLKSWINNTNEKNIKYFLIIFIIYKIIIHTIVSIPGLNIISKFSSFCSSIDIPISGYYGYYIFGYYLSQLDLSKIKSCYSWLALLSITIITCCLELLFSLVFHEYTNTYTIFSEVFSVNIFLIAMLLFVSCKITFKDTNTKIIKNIASKTYGIYLFHVLGLQLLGKMGLGSSNAFIHVAASASVVFIFSYICTYLIQKVPYVGKYFK